MIWREKGPAQLRDGRVQGLCWKTSGLEPLQVRQGHIPGPGEEEVNLDLQPEPLEVGSRGPSLSWACGPVGLVTGTEPAPGPSGESKGEGPRGGEVWVLDLRAQAAAGCGVRWIRAETHTKECSPRKVLYCC